MKKMLLPLLGILLLGGCEKDQLSPLENEQDLSAALDFRSADPDCEQPACLAVVALIDEVTGLIDKGDIAPGTGQSILSKLGSIKKKLEKGQTEEAQAKLAELNTHLEELYADGELSLDLLDELLTSTNAVGCEITQDCQPPDICEEYAGGIVFYLVPEGQEMDLDGDEIPDQGLIAALPENEFVTQWGCSGSAVGATGTAIGTGWSNTDAIIASSCTIASQLPAGWFIPSNDELNLMWENLADGDGDDFNSGPQDPDNCGGFASDGYWSSTEFGGNVGLAWGQNFGYGFQYYHGVPKLSDLRVRAVRAF